MIISLKYVYIRYDVGHLQAIEMLLQCYTDTTFVQVAVIVSDISCGRLFFF